MLKTWSKPKDIASKIEKVWEHGDVLRSCLVDDGLFPFRIKLEAPRPSELSLNFADAIDWVAQLQSKEKSKTGYGYELIFKETNNRISGKNSMPTHAVISSAEDAIKLIRKEEEVRVFKQNSKELLERWRLLSPWITQYPFKLINKIGKNCDKIIIVLQWFEAHPDHYLYVRQLDIPGIDTKFIENNKTIIGELLEQILPGEQVNFDVKGFEDRFFLKKKPVLIRFRILDTNLTRDGLSDLTVPIEEFAAWQPTIDTVFFTENEINFLSFPQVRNSCIVFGKGYGVETFKAVTWMGQKNVYYWGDIDTHGFNILSMARGFLPDIKSFLMTEEILMSHKPLWVTEDKPFLASINNLTDEEELLVTRLQQDYYGKGVRLEQERVGFGFVEEFIKNT